MQWSGTSQLTQILSDKLSYDADKITVMQGDSARGLRVPQAVRMTTILGSATAEAAKKIISAALPYAAHGNNEEQTTSMMAYLSRKIPTVQLIWNICNKAGGSRPAASMIYP